MLIQWSAGGREFEPRPGHYSRRVFSPTRQLVRFSHLNVPFFPNYEFIYNIVLIKLQAICAFCPCKKTANSAVIIIIIITGGRPTQTAGGPADAAEGRRRGEGGATDGAVRERGWQLAAPAGGWEGVAARGAAREDGGTATDEGRAGEGGGGAGGGGEGGKGTGEGERREGRGEGRTGGGEGMEAGKRMGELIGGKGEGKISEGRWMWKAFQGDSVWNQRIVV